MIVEFFCSATVVDHNCVTRLLRQPFFFLFELTECCLPRVSVMVGPNLVRFPVAVAEMNFVVSTLSSENTNWLLLGDRPHKQIFVRKVLFRQALSRPSYGNNTSVSRVSKGPQLKGQWSRECSHLLRLIPSATPISYGQAHASCRQTGTVQNPPGYIQKGVVRENRQMSQGSG